MATSYIRVMIVDDHEVVRSGIVSLFKREPDLRIVGEATSGEQALVALQSLRPDVVLLDQRLPGMTGAETCREIVRRWPSTAVLILTSFASDEVIHSCLAAGARGYLTKSIETTDLPRAVRAVARGESILAPSVTERVIDWARRAKAAHVGSSLSPREVEILSLLAEGMSNRELAGRLGMREATVKASVQATMRKLGVTRRWEAVAVAIDRGVI